MEFGRRLAEINRRLGVVTIAYCLMGNHYHLVLRAPDRSLSPAMQHLGTTYTARTNARHGRDGPLFRGRFHSIPIETDTYLTWAVRYVHRNPLDLVGVSNPAAYRWSSYRTYLGVRSAPSFVDTALILGMFGDEPRRLAAYTEDESMNIVGSSWTIADIRQLIEFEIRSSDLARSEPAPSTAWRTRTVFVLLMAATQGHWVSAAIAEHLGSPGRSASRKALERARSRAAADPVLLDVVGAMSKHVDAWRVAA